MCQATMGLLPILLCVVVEVLFFSLLAFVLLRLSLLGLALALLLVQCKDGHQEVTLSMIATEATKAFIPTYVQTLCILCVGGVNASVFEHPQALVTAQAISFPCGANLSDTLTLPDSIDVVIVTEEGLKSFVSEPNYQLLRTAVSPLALALLYQNNRG